MTSQRVILAALVLGFGGTAAYGVIRPTSVAKAALTNGQVLSQVVPKTGAAVVLMYDPADCAQCDIALGTWQEWGRVHPGRLIFVLTRPPNSDERKELAFARLAPAGELAPKWATSLFAHHQQPTEVLFVNGKQVYKDVIASGLSTPLLNRLSDVSQAELLSARGARLTRLVNDKDDR